VVKYGDAECSSGGLIWSGVGIGIPELLLPSPTMSVYCSGVSTPCSTIFSSTRLRRAVAASGNSRGEYALGDEIIPASSAASSGRSWDAQRLSSPPHPGWFHWK
jgi:hypothetical protein